MIRLFIFSIFIFSFSADHAQLTSTESSEGIEILDKGQKVLFYQVKPKSLNGKYERAGYVHPLYSLKGNVLTEDFPEDHPHHHGIFWAWHQIMLNGKQIADGWTSDSISWKVEKTTVKKEQGRISIIAEVIWTTQTVSGIKTPIVKENTIVTAYESTERQRAIDFDIQLIALVDSLKIGGSDDPKGYGGFSLRLKLPDDIKFFSNDQSVIPQEMAVTAGPMMDFVGSFEGAAFPKSAVFLAVNPNENIPQQSWILRSKASMQNAVYPGREPVALTKKGWRLKYRLVVKN